MKKKISLKMIKMKTTVVKAVRNFIQNEDGDFKSWITEGGWLYVAIIGVVIMAAIGPKIFELIGDWITNMITEVTKFSPF